MTGRSSRLVEGSRVSKVFSVRLGDDLGARVVEIAEAKGVKAPTVLKAAVESYVDDFSRGAPEVGSDSSASSEAPKSEPRREQARRVLAEVQRPPAALRDVNPRQAALNDMKYGKGNW